MSWVEQVRSTDEYLYSAGLGSVLATKAYARGMKRGSAREQFWRWDGGVQGR